LILQKKDSTASYTQESAQKHAQKHLNTDIYHNQNKTEQN